MAERRREAGDQAGKHAELLSLGIALQCLHPQEKEADALATDLQVDSGADPRQISCNSNLFSNVELLISDKSLMKNLNHEFSCNEWNLFPSGYLTLI